MFSLGVIPARGGSKRLPGKNIRHLCGKPLIAWSIVEALRSKLDHVIVSTDDLQIANTAKDWGADVPFIRPADLATDEAKSIDVMIHAAKWCEKNVQKPDYVFLLQPTSPTRTADDIDVAIDILSKDMSQGYVTLTEGCKPNGLLYATSWDLLMKDHLIWNMYSTLFVCLSEVVDIDTEEDWQKAERALCGRS